MQDSRLIQLLKSLTSEEIENLYFFINSPFFFKPEIFGSHKPMSRNKILQFYFILKNEYPEFTGSILKDESIFRKIFKTEKYNYGKLASLEHDLLRIIEIYLSYIDILDEPIHPKIHLINQLDKRGLDKFLISNIDETIRLLDKDCIKDEDYYFQKYSLSKKSGSQMKKEFI